LIIKDVGKIIECSSIYETAPWGVHEQPTFLNQVISIKTSYSPEELLDILLNIEVKMGRKRYRKWDSRLIDIDILFYENQIISTNRLILPHPEIENRRFTLAPLSEIAADEIHPLLNKTIEELLKETRDPLEAKKWYSKTQNPEP